MRLGEDTIRCLTFDLDDTLWACAPVIHAAESTFYSWLEANYPAISEAYDLEALTAHRRKLFARYPEKSHDFSWLRKRWLRHLVEETGVDAALEAEGFSIYHSARNDVKMFPGAVDTLAMVSASYQCGSITNGNADIAMVGIDRFFDFEITASNAGATKPSRIIYDAAIAAADYSAREILHIGDDPDKDVRGAAAVGMHTLWVNPQGSGWVGDNKPDLELREITALPRLIAQHSIVNSVG